MTEIPPPSNQPSLRIRRGPRARLAARLLFPFPLPLLALLLAVIPAEATSVIATIPLGASTCPHGVGVNSVTNRIYVAKSGCLPGYTGNTVAVIDGVTNAILTNVTVGTGAFGVGVNRVEFFGVEPSERSLGGSRGRQARPNPVRALLGVLAQLLVNNPGLYRLRFEDVFGASRRGVNARSLRLSRQGQAVAYHLELDKVVFGPG